jgi:regulator of sirC expression with transglutaminase-like and TPR domain
MSDLSSLQADLTDLGRCPDEDIPLGGTALLLASRYHEGLDLGRYHQHLLKISADVRQRAYDLVQAGADDSAHTRIAALKHVISDQLGYRGNKDNYDDLQNADLICVIDQRKGLPIALSILALEASRAQKWDVEGLNFPGHFLLRIEHLGTRLIFDPFDNFKILEAPDLRALLKAINGAKAELSASYYMPAGNRDILIRLQNNIKLRQVEAEDYAGALETVELMRLLAPDENRLLFDAGVLYARTGKRQQAIVALEGYIIAAPNPDDRYDAQQLLQNLIDSPL